MIGEIREQVDKAESCKSCPRYADSRCTAITFNRKTKADILLVCDQPDLLSAANNSPLLGHSGNVIKSALQMAATDNPEHAALVVAATYAVQCIDKKETNPSRLIMDKCKTYLEATISSHSPKIIVAMGATALKQLGIKDSFKDMRGRIVEANRFKIPIFVTFSDKALLAQPGLFTTFKLDLKNIYDKVLNKRVYVSIDELTKNYVFPQTIEEVKELCAHIVDFAERDHPADWAISVDTETTTLRPEKTTSRIIAFCIAWAPGKATTIIYDHPNAPPEYLARLPEVTDALRTVLSSAKPKIFHNAKFDLKFIERRYGIKVNNVSWDTLLGEHLLDEDKKGNYGLKVLTSGWLPKYCGYEDKLYDLLNEQEYGVDETLLLDKRINDLQLVLTEDQKHYLDALALYKVQKIKYNEEMEVYAPVLEKYNTEIKEYEDKQADYKQRLHFWEVSKIGKKPTKGYVRPKKPVKPVKVKEPEDPRSKKEKQVQTDAGFETLPIKDLSVYGAIDADVTRQLVKIQLSRIQAEKSRVGLLMRSHAIPVSRVLGGAEYHGTRIDHNYAAKLDVGLTKIIEDCEIELYQMAGTMQPGGVRPLNIGSSQQLGNILFNWGWTHPDGTPMKPYDPPNDEDRTAQGLPSTADKTLKKYLAYEDKEKEIPTRESYFIERYGRWKKAKKAKETFLTNIRLLSRRDGFLHTSFHINGTGTGRLSCVSADTLLETNHGKFKICDLALSTQEHRILSHTRKWCRILRIFPKGEDSMFRVTLFDGKTIKVTAKHRFLTPEGWQALGTLGAYRAVIINTQTGFDTQLIKQIEYVGEETVWDLTVEDDESYVAHGFVNHNSSDMNLQNIPKYLAGWNIKKLFIPSDDDLLMCNCDWKGAEVRVFTVYARDQVLIDAINNGLDMHCYFAAEVFKRPYEQYDNRDNPAVIPDPALREILNKERTMIKRVVFGILYGAGPNKIAETIGVSFEEAKRLITLLYQMFPAIEAYGRQIEREVELQGYVETMFSRRRRFPLKGISRHRQRANRQAKNFKIQSTSSDIVLGQLVEMDEHLPHELGGRTLMTVHDSILFEFKRKYLHQVKDFVTYYGQERVAQKYPWLPVPFKIDIEVGPSYGECQEIDSYIKENPFIPTPEGVLEEQELLNELRNDAFEAA